MLQLDFYNRTKTKITKRIFKNLLKRAEVFLIKEKTLSRKKRNFLIEVSVIENKKMIELNRYYHQKNRPTDVIALSYFEKRMHDSFAGEIFICLPYARKQAKKIGQSLTPELQFLFVHGLLHLFGYDHKKPREEERMKKLTYKILGRV